MLGVGGRGGLTQFCPHPQLFSIDKETFEMLERTAFSFARPSSFSQFPMVVINFTGVDGHHGCCCRAREPWLTLGWQQCWIHTCRMFLGRWEPTSLRQRQIDLNTLKVGQKHHFYTTVLARRRQNGPGRRETLKSGEPRSPEPGVSTGMVEFLVILPRPSCFLSDTIVCHFLSLHIMEKKTLSYP